MRNTSIVLAATAAAALLIVFLHHTAEVAATRDKAYWRTHQMTPGGIPHPEVSPAGWAD